MKLTNLVGLFALIVLIPTTAIAGEIKVKTGNVEAATYSDGSVYVKTGRTTAQVPRYYSSQFWNPFRYWRLPWQSQRLLRRKSGATPRRFPPQGNAHQDTTEPALTVGKCRNSSYQRTTQVTRTGSRVVQSNVSTHSCR